MKFSKLCAFSIGLGAVLGASFSIQAAPSTKEIAALATIASIDRNEIIVSTVAVNKVSQADVVDFAKMMISQHGSNLVQILNIPKDNKEFAKDLSKDKAEKISLKGNESLAQLGALQGAEFDRQYVNEMVKGHEAVLHLIDHKLMKKANSPEIKQFLTQTRATVAEHLEHAIHLQKKING